MPRVSRAARLAGLALALGIIGISFSPIFVKLSEIGPTTTAFYRVGFALPVLAAWVMLERQGPVKPRPLTRRDWLLLASSGLFFTLDLVAWHASIRMTGIANATFLGNLGTLVVLFGAWLILREPLSLGSVVGMPIALAGVGLLLGASALGAFGSSLAGDGLGLVTAVFYGAYLLNVKYLRSHGMPTGMVMAGSSAFATLGFLPFAFSFGETFIPASLFGWAMLIGVALISQAGGQSLIALAMRRLPASLVSVSLLMNPVLSGLLAWIILGQTLTPLQGAGCAVVLAGLLIALRLRRPLARRMQPSGTVLP